MSKIQYVSLIKQITLVIYLQLKLVYILPKQYFVHNVRNLAKFNTFEFTR